MNAGDLLRRLDDLGVSLTLAGDRIRYRSPDGRLTPELMAEMKEHKDQLITLLERRKQLRWPPVRDKAGRERRGPLTRAQRTFWATDYFLDDGTYNLSGAIRLRGPLEDAAFTAALEDTQRLHPSLRTVFPVDVGEPGQHVLPAVTVPIEQEDFTGRPLAECLHDCARLADAKLPLVPRPPVRMRLYRLGRDDHVFFVVLHHIVADAVSVRILVDDLARLYNARLSGVTVAPPASDLDMIDVALSEADRFSYADLSAARRYWRERLSDAALGWLPLPPPLRAEGPSQRGGAYSVLVDAATTAMVRREASASRSSAFIVVSAAVSAMLSRYTGRDDMVVGMPVGRRDRPGLEHLVGPLLDMVPLRLDVRGSPAFQDLVARTRVAVLGAAGNAEVPADPQTAGRPAQGDAAGRGLFNVILTDLGARLPDPEFRGLDAAYLEVPRFGAKYDMNFMIRDDRDTLGIEVEWDRRAVDDPDVAAMVSMARRILTEGAADSRLQTADLAAAPSGTAGMGAAGVPAAWTPSRHESLPGRFAEVARDRGDEVAVSHDGASLSYRALAEQADRVARGLRREGLGIGDVVAVSLPRGIDLVVAILGIMGSGAACLALDDSWPAARTERVLADAGVRRIITATAGLAEGTSVARLARLGTQAFPCGSVPACATAYVIYTSGSTGHPKGVHVTHANLLSLLGATGDGFGLGHGDVWRRCSTPVPSMWPCTRCSAACCTAGGWSWCPSG